MNRTQRRAAEKRARQAAKSGQRLVPTSARLVGSIAPEHERTFGAINEILKTNGMPLGFTGPLIVIGIDTPAGITTEIKDLAHFIASMEASGRHDIARAVSPPVPERAVRILAMSPRHDTFQAGAAWWPALRAAINAAGGSA